MKPITFSCQATLPFPPEEIASLILDLSQWPHFRGYGPIPGIKTASFDTQPPGIIGTRIRVTNLDGSSHVEEIVEWQPNRRLQLHMGEFSPPLARLAERFLETWDLQRVGNESKVVRSFEIMAKSRLTRPLLWCLSFFLQRAITRHLAEMAGMR